MAAGEGTYPTVDSSIYAEAGPQTRELIELSQPEAVAAQMTATVDNLRLALSALRISPDVFPVGAVDNAKTQLPPEEAALLEKQLEFAASLASDEYVSRIGDSLFVLAMQAATLERRQTA